MSISPQLKRRLDELPNIIHEFAKIVLPYWIIGNLSHITIFMTILTISALGFFGIGVLSFLLPGLVTATVAADVAQKFAVFAFVLSGVTYAMAALIHYLFPAPTRREAITAMESIAIQDRQWFKNLASLILCLIFFSILLFELLGYIGVNRILVNIVHNTLQSYPPILLDYVCAVVATAIAVTAFAWRGRIERIVIERRYFYKTYLVVLIVLVSLAVAMFEKFIV